MEQGMDVRVDVKDVFQHDFYADIADDLELAEADAGEGLPVIVNWIGFEELSVRESQSDMYGGILLIFLGKTTENAPKRAGSTKLVTPVRN